MKIAEAQRELDTFLTDIATPFGFTHVALLEFSKTADDFTGILSFPCRLDVRGFAAFTCQIGIRVEALETLLNRGSKPRTSTFAVPIHFLRPDRKFTEWQFSNSRELSALSEAIAADIRDIAVPFINHYRNLDEIEKCLDSSDPRDWFALSPEGKVVLLAAIQAAKGQQKKAVKTLDDALAEREGELPKRRWELEQLRKRLAQSE